MILLKLNESSPGRYPASFPNGKGFSWRFCIAGCLHHILKSRHCIFCQIFCVVVHLQAEKYSKYSLRVGKENKAFTQTSSFLDPHHFRSVNLRFSSGEEPRASIGLFPMFSQVPVHTGKPKLYVEMYMIPLPQANPHLTPNPTLTLTSPHLKQSR